MPAGPFYRLSGRPSCQELGLSTCVSVWDAPFEKERYGRPVTSPESSNEAPSGTWEEPQERAGRLVAMLIHVLGYDDLLADDACALDLSGAADEVCLGREESSQPAALCAPARLGLRDRWSSSRHAALRRRKGSYVLSDLGSRNGTFVNGIRVREQCLLDGDLVEVGHTLFCYREMDEAVARKVLDDPPALGPTRTRCPALTKLAGDIEHIARSNEPVLLLGETGTGKEIVAGALHARSGRSGRLVAVDCGAVPETLFESTFFGHVRGAFTGANEARTGELERADGGTLFLDEVANMGLAQQAKLLRALESGEVTPLGAVRPIRLDLRIVAATNGKLFGHEARFRPDLLQRLSGYVARLPPLRRRREDLGSLTAYLLREAGHERLAITAAGGRRLFTDPFAGNVRQLRTTLRTAALLAGDAPIDLAHLGSLDASTAAPCPSVPVASATTGSSSRKRVPPSPPRGRESATSEQVAAALRGSAGNVVHAARRLQTHPRQMYRLIKRYGLDLQSFRP